METDNMGIYAIAIENTRGKVQYRLARQDGLIKVAPREFLLQKTIGVGNLTIGSGYINPFSKLPEIIGNAVENKLYLTILSRNYRTYTVCNFAGKTVTCNFEDIESLQFTNAILDEYIDYLGFLSKAFRYCNETYEEFVDRLLEDGKNLSNKLNGGKLDKLIVKVNSLGESTQYVVDENGVLKISDTYKEHNKVFERFKIPHGVRQVESFPACRELIGSPTVESLNITSLVAKEVELIDLSDCTLIVDIKQLEGLLNRCKKTKKIIFPKNLKALSCIGTASYYFTETETLHFGPYITEVGDRFFQYFNGKIYFDSKSNIRTIGIDAFSKKYVDYDFDFSDCISLQKICERAFENIGNEILDLRKCISLTEVGKYAFYENSAKKILLPDNIIKVGVSAFISAGVLEYMNIPRNISDDSLNYILISLPISISSHMVLDIPRDVYERNKGRLAALRYRFSEEQLVINKI